MNIKREQDILEILIKKKEVTVSQLAKELYASEPSIRRDLRRLEQKHLLRRTHGGAVLDENGISEIKVPFHIREMEDADEKTCIAENAEQLIKDENVIFLDASTSACSIVPFLAEKKNIIVITNGIHTVAKCSEYGIKTIATGGDVVNSCFAMVGENACDAIDNYHADLAFFSCRGMSMDGFLTDIAEKENLVRRHMIANADSAYMLLTKSKKGSTHFHKLCHISDITGVITSEGISMSEKCKKVRKKY